MQIEPTTKPRPLISQADLVRGWAECWKILRENGKTFHVMARVPAGISSGAVPVELVVGGASSQAEVTVAIK